MPTRVLHPGAFLRLALRRLSGGWFTRMGTVDSLQKEGLFAESLISLGGTLNDSLRWHCKTHTVHVKDFVGQSLLRLPTYTPRPRLKQETRLLPFSVTIWACSAVQTYRYPTRGLPTLTSIPPPYSSWSPRSGHLTPPSRRPGDDASLHHVPPPPPAAGEAVATAGSRCGTRPRIGLK